MSLTKDDWYNLAPNSARDVRVVMDKIPWDFLKHHFQTHQTAIILKYLSIRHTYINCTKCKIRWCKNALRLEYRMGNDVWNERDQWHSTSQCDAYIMCEFAKYAKIYLKINCAVCTCTSWAFVSANLESIWGSLIGQNQLVWSRNRLLSKTHL